MNTQTMDNKTKTPGQHTDHKPGQPPASSNQSPGVAELNTRVENLLQDNSGMRQALSLIRDYSQDKAHLMIGDVTLQQFCRNALTGNTAAPLNKDTA